jgi:hypothetical protein
MTRFRISARNAGTASGKWIQPAPPGCIDTRGIYTREAQAAPLPRVRAIWSLLAEYVGGERDEQVTEYAHVAQV